MTKRTRVLLYGNSLVVEGIGAGLGNTTELDVVRLPRALPGDSDFKTLAPEVIVFDIDTPGYTAVFSALEDNPDLVLLGVSADTNVVRVWSGRRYEELSVSDLATLIGDGAYRAVPVEHDALTKQQR